MTYDLRTFTFGHGSHKTREDGMCVMEAVAYLAGEEHSDKPACASPVITRLAIWLNDSCSDALRQELLRDLPWRIVGTKAAKEIEVQRGFMAADWAVRVVAPMRLRRVGLDKMAAELEAFPPIVDKASALAARDAYRAADADAAAYAVADADAAAYADAVAAAVAYADAAAYAVADADAAAYAAAVAYADAAAAAYAAAYAYREALQRSCAALLDRMIRLTEPQEPATRELLVREGVMG